MKKNYLLTLITITLFFTQMISSQEAGFKRWNLKAVKASFDLPASWSILENQGKEFVARDQKSPELLSLRVGPWQDGKLDAKGVANAGWNYKFERGAQEIPVKNRMLFIENEFSGLPFNAYLNFGLMDVGSTDKFYVVVVGLADPKSTDRIFMRFTWNRKDDDGKDKEKTKKSQQKNLELIDKIIKSVQNL